MALATVLIDLDGTLWDSAPWYAALLAPGDARECAKLTAGFRDAAGGPRAATLLKQKYTAAAFGRAAHAEARALRLYTGAQKTLCGLSKQVVLGVVTSLPGWMARPMLEAVDLADRFEVIQTAAWRVPAKPHPASLNLALEAIGRSAATAAYVGDSDTDAKAASRAGMSFVGAGWGYGRLEGEDVVDDWAAVRSVL